MENQPYLFAVFSTCIVVCPKGWNVYQIMHEAGLPYNEQHFAEIRFGTPLYDYDLIHTYTGSNGQSALVFKKRV